MRFDNSGASLGPRRGRRAKGGLAALLALFLIALMAPSAQAATHAYSLSVKTAEGGSTPLYNPAGVAVDGAGNVYVTTLSPASIQKFSSSGKFLAKFGGTCSEPSAVDVEASGNVWVNCKGNKMLIKFSSTGTILKEVSTAGLGRPFGVAVDGVGNVWWLASEASAVFEFDATGKYIGGGSMIGANAIAVDPAGALWASKGETVTGAGHSWKPATYAYGIDADASGDLWIASGTGVRKYSPLGVQLESFGSYGTGVGQFLGTSQSDGVAIGPEGAVWAVNPPHNEVQKWVPVP